MPSPEVVTLTAKEFVDKFYNCLEWAMYADDRADMHVIHLYVAEEDQTFASPRLHLMERDEYQWFTKTCSAILAGKKLVEPEDEKLCTMDIRLECTYSCEVYCERWQQTQEERVMHVILTPELFVKKLKELIKNKQLSGTYSEAGQVRITKMTEHGEFSYKSPSASMLSDQVYAKFRAEIDKIMPPTDHDKNYYW